MKSEFISEQRSFSLYFTSVVVTGEFNSVVDAFKARLDKFWKHQSVKFDFTADLTGTANRSEEVIK